MKILIPTLNRQETIKTHLLLEGLDYKIIVHDPLQLYQYKQNKTIPPERLVCSYAPRNISKQRNWIRDNLVEKDEWFCFMDDNISGFHTVKPEAYHIENLGEIYPEYFKKNNVAFRNEFYRYILPRHEISDRLYELRKKCMQSSTTLGAMNANSNYFFSRDKKWKYYQLICSKACVVKNDELRYDERIHTIDDYEYSCQVMHKYGKVVVNAYMWPISKHNSKGGIGRMKERGDLKVADCAIIMNKWPGLLKYKSRRNSVPNGEVQLRGFGEKFYTKWRNEWESKASLTSAISAS